MANTANTTNAWLPLMDYALKKGLSLSTLRRHIKANKLTFKVENGRYLIWDGESSPPSSAESLHTELSKVMFDLQKAQEEIAELKTLIACYEEYVPQQHSS
jgi:hypothetical protein